MRRSNLWVGIIFILLGVFFLLNNFNILDFSIVSIISRFWPSLFFVLPGLAFHSLFFSGTNKDAGILVPGGILLTMGVVLQISVAFNAFDVMWPGFIAAVAVGLFELYYFGSRDKVLLIPAGILGGLSLLFFSTFSMSRIFGGMFKQLFLPVVLIIAGLVVMLNGKFGRKKV